MVNKFSDTELKKKIKLTEQSKEQVVRSLPSEGEKSRSDTKSEQEEKANKKKQTK